jgi:hypothetical protein
LCEFHFNIEFGRGICGAFSLFISISGNKTELFSLLLLVLVLVLLMCFDSSSDVKVGEVMAVTDDLSSSPEQDADDKHFDIFSI